MRRSTNELTVTTPVSSLATFTPQAQEFAGKSRSARTVAGYASDWRSFQAWCASRNHRSLPALPSTVATYLTEGAVGEGARKTGTLARWLAAISSAHRLQGQADPTKDASLELVWQGIRRTNGTAQTGKAPILIADIRQMVQSLTDSALDVRDRALLLLGFAGALRRSELVDLDVVDLTETGEGLKVAIRRSKTDQEGKGQELGIPFGSHPETCPVLAVRRWLEVSGITAGPIFRGVNKAGRVGVDRLTAQVVALVVKRRAHAVGIAAGSLAGHSLRAGLATSAALADVPERLIQKQTRHKSTEMVRRYIRTADLFRENAAGRVGL